MRGTSSIAEPSAGSRIALEGETSANDNMDVKSTVS